MPTALEHAGDTIENPTDADIDRVLSAPREDDWFVSLNRGDDAMEVMFDEGALSVDVTEGVRLRRAGALEAPVVKSMLASFRDGTDAWRGLARWKDPPPDENPETTASAKAAVGALLVAIGLPMAVAVFLDRPAWAVVFFLLAFPGLIAVAAIVKAGEMKRAAAWHKASGRITVSELADGTYEERQVKVPRVEYEYGVGAETKVGTRVNLAEAITGVQAKEAVARYPVGATVEVYYNPANPSEAVLEVEAPPEIMPAAWGIVAFLTAAILLGAWFFLIRK